MNIKSTKHPVTRVKAGVSLLSAQPEQEFTRTRRLLQGRQQNSIGVDVNDDGRLSKLEGLLGFREWDANSRRHILRPISLTDLASQDRNGDGFVTNEELPDDLRSGPSPLKDYAQRKGLSYKFDIANKTLETRMLQAPTKPGIGAVGGLATVSALGFGALVLSGTGAFSMSSAVTQGIAFTAGLAGIGALIAGTAGETIPSVTPLYGPGRKVALI